MRMEEAIDWRTCAFPYLMLRVLKPLAGSKIIDRKLRLFAVCCARQTLGLVGGRVCPEAVSTAELYADDHVGVEELAAARDAVETVVDRLRFRIRDLNLTRRLLGCQVVGPTDSDVDEWSIWDCDEASREGRRLNAASAVLASVEDSRVVNQKTHEDLKLGAWFAGHIACMRSYCASASREDLEAMEQRFLSEADEVNQYEDPWRAGTLRCLFGDPFKPTPTVPPDVVDQVRSFATDIYQGRRFDELPELGRACYRAGLRNDDILDHLSSPVEHQRGCWALDLVLGMA